MTAIHKVTELLFGIVKDIGQSLADSLRAQLEKYSQFPLAYTALSYLFVTMAICYYPVTDHWLTGFVMMSLPLAIFFGLISSIYLLYKQQKSVAMAGIIWVLFALLVIKRLLGVSLGSEYVSREETALNVLSFNSETFPTMTQKELNAFPVDADIACFQEYSPNQQLETLYPAKIEKLTSFDNNRKVGLALLSKYPIVNEYGRIWNRAEGPDINGFLCADIAYGADTIRVVNVHLWSMGVRTNQAVDAWKAGQIGQFFYEIGNTFQRLKEGFENRSEQLREVESYVVGSRYPVIICGDFNETPIGYSYGKLSRNFSNAFEEAGHGLGFTLNRHPYYVRIDQQFVSSDWRTITCQTVSGVSFSDHFPVLAQYVLKKSANDPANTLARKKAVGSLLAGK